MGCILTGNAQKDIDEIADYSLQNHGEERTALYLEELHDKFDHIVLNPSLGTRRTDIREGLYSRVHQRHTIFYRMDGEAITVLRVLHQSRDVQRVFA